ncbi:alpha/beta fold hydrolase [Luteococcus sp. Sow4_B9]|uniref:alpha/beta fold hydrolase n=1 Tax=Luteococcus sp. Sow4_B9 TaxID=3438792 RepID=UPI003F9EB4D9
MSRKDSATAQVKAPLATRLRMAALEKISPQRAAAVGVDLWFQVPAPPKERTLGKYTPSGGEPFFLMSGDAEITGYAFGPERGPVALLVHGWGGHWQLLQAHIGSLVERGYRVVAFDMPSHGRSTHGAEGFGMASAVEMAQAVEAVIGEGGNPTVVLAHGRGAMAVLRALRGRPMPRACVLFAPEVSIEPAIDWFAQVVGMGPRTRAIFAQQVEARLGAELADFDLRRDVARMAAREDCPQMLVVHDEGDPENPLSASEELHEMWPGSELMVTANQGHRKLIWHDEVVKRVDEFLGAVGGGRHGLRRVPG